MLSASDFIRLPYDPDLTEGGIALALRALTREQILYDRLRRMVAGFAVELAFRRHLSRNAIPYEVAPALPLAERERHDVLLNGRRCDLKSFFISDRNQILNIRRQPEILLDAPALVPSDINAGEGHADQDLYVFAFVTGLKAASPRDVTMTATAHQPHYFMRVMPERWRSPAHWHPLGTLTLKSESQLRVGVEICGLNQAREFVARQVQLPPRKRVAEEHQFHSIACLHLENFPAARLGIALQGSPIVIAPEEWKNIWVYGLEIIFAGYITRGEFCRRAGNIPPGTRVFQYNRTRVKNLAVPVASLRPLKDLFQAAVS